MSTLAKSTRRTTKLRPYVNVAKVVHLIVRIFDSAKIYQRASLRTWCYHKDILVCYALFDPFMTNFPTTLLYNIVMRARANVTKRSLTHLVTRGAALAANRREARRNRVDEGSDASLLILRNTSSFGSVLFFGSLRCTARSSGAQAFSIGFRSGDWAGQSRSTLRRRCLR